MKLSWKIETPTRLATFLKNKVREHYATKDIILSVNRQRCIVNGLTERFESYKLKIGDYVEFFPEKYDTVCFDPNKIILDTPEYLIYDKPPYISTEDLISLTEFFCVHRLDRDTTGCLIMAKTKESRDILQDLFRERKIQKTYVALTYGKFLKSSGTLSTHTSSISRRQGHVLIGNVHPPLGKLTVTSWKVLQSGRSTTLVECKAQTGRTHQIRIHMKTIGHPIVGDLDYGSKAQQILSFRCLLHASKLDFYCPFSKHPISCVAKAKDIPSAI